MLASLALLVAFQAPPRLPPAIVPEGLGVNVHLDGGKTDWFLRMRDAGFRWARVDVDWAGIERSSGTYDFAKLDSIVAASGSVGIRLLLIVDYGNPIYGEGPPLSGEAAAGFDRFVAALGRRYARRGILWEVWNEPNAAKFWKPAPDPRAYALLAQRTAALLRKESSTEMVAGLATQTFDWGFLTQALENRAARSFDAVSVHPYRPGGPETVQADYRRLAALIRWTNPGHAVPIVCSEWGYSGVEGVSDQNSQAQALLRAYLTNLASGVSLTILYNWTDHEPEEAYGLTRDGTIVKPAYLAIQSFVQALSGARFVGEVATAPPAHVLRFRRAGRELLVGWSEADSSEAAIEGRTIQLTPMPRLLD